MSDLCGCHRVRQVSSHSAGALEGLELNLRRKRPALVRKWQREFILAKNRGQLDSMCVLGPMTPQPQQTTPARARIGQSNYTRDLIS